jgi:SepF-like predicted cell division protein (DUF552 family)
MGLRNMISRRGEDFDEFAGEEYMEVNLMDAEEKKMGKLGIKIESLEDFADTERILKQIREGAVIFLKIKGLRDKDMGELKRAVEKLKRGVTANNGDIAGVEQDWLILTPHYAVIHR